MLTISKSVRDIRSAFDKWRQPTECQPLHKTTSTQALHPETHRRGANTERERRAEWKSLQELTEQAEKPNVNESKFPTGPAQYRRPRSGFDQTVSAKSQNSGSKPQIKAALQRNREHERTKGLGIVPSDDAGFHDGDSKDRRNQSKSRQNGNTRLKGSNINIGYLASNENLVGFANNPESGQSMTDLQPKIRRYRKRTDSFSGNDETKNTSVASNSTTNLHKYESSRSLHNIEEKRSDRPHSFVGESDHSRYRSPEGDRTKFSFTGNSKLATSRSRKNSKSQEQITEGTQYSLSKSSSGVTGSCVSLPKSDAEENEKRLMHFISETGQHVQPVLRKSRAVSEPNLQNAEPKVTALSRPTSASQVNVENCKNLTIVTGSDTGGSKLSLLSAVSDGQQSVIGDNVTAATKELLDDHRRFECDSTTRRFREAARVLDKFGLLVLLGHPGDGTSHLVYDLMMRYTDYQKYILNEPSEWISCLKPDEKAVVLADDVFGIQVYDKKEVENWQKVLHRNSRSIQKGNSKVIFVIKHSVAKHCKEFLDKYYKHVVDIASPKLQLNAEEMLGIMKSKIKAEQKSLKVSMCGNNKETENNNRNNNADKEVFLCEDTIRDIAKVALPSGFPAQLHTFLSKRTCFAEGVGYFKDPTPKLYNEIDSLKRNLSETENLNKYCALAAKLVFNGPMTEADINKLCPDSRHGQYSSKRLMHALTSCSKHSHQDDGGTDKPKVTPSFIHFLPDLFRMLKLDGNMGDHIRRGVELLKGTLLTSTPSDAVEFSAPCVRTAFMVSCGQIFTTDIVKQCDEYFFYNFIDVYTGVDSHESPRVHIRLQDDSSCAAAIDILKTDILGGNVEKSVAHRLLKDPQFVDLFFKTIKKERKMTTRIISAHDKDSRRSLISHGLDHCYRNAKESEPQNIAESILFHSKWPRKRQIDKQWVADQEQEVLEHCCKEGMSDTYFKLVEKLRVPITKQCLMYSINSGSIDIVEDILTTKPTPVDRKDMCNALQIACLNVSRQNTEDKRLVLEALLKYVPIDFKVHELDSIVHLAAKTGDGRLLVVLKYYKADINLTNSEGETCLHLAAKHGHSAFTHAAIVKCGAQQRKVTRSKKRLPIHVAAEFDKANVMKILFDNDREVIHCPDKNGQLPLHVSAFHNSVATAEFLIEKHANVDAIDLDRKTPLHLAALSGKAEVMHFLLEAKADPRCKDNKGDTPLMIACKFGNAKALKRVLKDKRSRQTMDKESVFVAVEQGRQDMVEEFLRHGINMNIRKSSDEPLLHFAISRKKEMVPLLIENGANVSVPFQSMYPIHLSTKRGDCDVIDQLLESGANIDDTTQETHDTILHIAVKHELHGVVSHIVALETSQRIIHCKNRKGETALHIAARMGNFDTIQLLLSHGLRTSEPSRSSQTPLDLARIAMKTAQRQHHVRKQEHFRKVVDLISSYRQSAV